MLVDHPPRFPLAAVRGLLAAAALTVLAAGALAHPKPSPVPTRWELAFAAGGLRLYIDPIDRTGYWYFTYKVTNRTGKDQVWAPNFTLFTDSGQILVSGREVPSRVTSDLLDLLGNPLLEEQNTIIGNILHGRDHAKEGLVVWPAPDLKVNELSLFVRGVSGETARAINPVNGTSVTLYKTLQRDYLIRGNARSRGAQPVELVAERWIMR